MGISRRNFLSGAAALMAIPGITFAQAATERRFVFIIQRGAADGLHTLIPYADPAYAKLRGAIAVDPSTALKLDGTFALHPSLPEISKLYAAGQASFFHAVSSAYRDRSHFDGQNVLETGSNQPYQLKDGWMNRLVSLLPQRGEGAIAFAPAVPMALRGPAKVTTYAPSTLPQASEDLLMRVEQLYARDTQLHALWSAALRARNMAGGMESSTNRQDPSTLGRLASSFLAKSDGPRLAMIETEGWDTHSGQIERLSRQFRNLDRLILGLHQGLGAHWSQTVILVATEFGRTAAANGTGGTDHGTASLAMLMGGAVRGGRIISDWPGLAPANLLDGRDLRPTLGLDTLVAQVCSESFRIDPEQTLRTLYPNASKDQALPQLLVT